MSRALFGATLSDKSKYANRMKPVYMATQTMGSFGSFSCRAKSHIPSFTAQNTHRT